MAGATEAVQAIGGAVQAIKAVAAVATVAMGIYETVEGNTTKGLAMITGGAMLGADTYEKMPGADVTSSLPVSSDISKNVSPVLDSPEKSPDVNLQQNFVQADNKITGLLGMEQAPRISSAGVSDATLPPPVATSAALPVTPVKQHDAATPTSSGGLLSGVTDFVKDNKDLIAMVGTGYGKYEDQQAYIKEKEKDRAAEAARINNNTVIPSAGAK